MTDQDQQAVDRLLKMYDEYKIINGELIQATSRLAKAKLQHQDVTSLKAAQQKLSDRLQKLSDEMTFGNPLIWIAYKYKAYQDEAQPILNMHDLRQHCAKPGYICTKRFQFVNQQLELAGKPSLANAEVYSDEQNLSEVLENASLVELSRNGQFGQLWDNYEYYVHDGQIAKWQNFIS